MGNDYRGMERPVTPYGGSSGWSGSEASRERAEYLDRSGITNKRQKKTIGLLNHYYRGLTWRKLNYLTGWGHQGASSVLSTLHKENYIVRLAEKDDGSHLYVLPEHVDGREISHRKMRMTQRDMRNHLLFVQAHARLMGDTGLQRWSEGLLDAYFDGWREETRRL